MDYNLTLEFDCNGIYYSALTYWKCDCGYTFHGDITEGRYSLGMTIEVNGRQYAVEYTISGLFDGEPMPKVKQFIYRLRYYIKHVVKWHKYLGCPNCGRLFEDRKEDSLLRLLETKNNKLIGTGGMWHYMEGAG